MENKTQNQCAICRELNKKIELAAFSWETIEFEVLMYQHKVKGACRNEKVAA